MGVCFNVPREFQGLLNEQPLRSSTGLSFHVTITGIGVVFWLLFLGRQTWFVRISYPFVKDFSVSVAWGVEIKCIKATLKNKQTKQKNITQTKWASFHHKMPHHKTPPPLQWETAHKVYCTVLTPKPCSSQEVTQLSKKKVVGVLLRKRVLFAWIENTAVRFQLACFLLKHEDTVVLCTSTPATLQWEAVGCITYVLFLYTHRNLFGANSTFPFICFYLLHILSYERWTVPAFWGYKQIGCISMVTNGRGILFLRTTQWVRKVPIV